ncbi:MAG: DUF721 domain-containing protein [SAR324 cluster bacterium]|nr:DUF721 domain-containing protein [SAR324 cluster bacterium]
MKKCEHISDTLPPTLKKLTSDHPYAMYMIYSNWKLIVGRDLWKHTRPSSIKYRSLMVLVQDASYGVALTPFKNHILSFISSVLRDANVIEKVVYRVGEFDLFSNLESYPPPVNNEGVSMKNEYFTELSPKEENKLAKEVEIISNPKLRDRCLNFRLAIKAQQLDT